MKKYKGFTLIELLVTVAIIAVLTAIVTANFAQARSRSRDAKRISDIANVQLALSLYFDRCGQYPNSQADLVPTTSDATCPAGISLGSFISKIPTPPQPGQTEYTYSTNVDPFGGIPNSTDYVIGIQLENGTDVLTDSIDGATYSVPCSKANKYYCVGPK